MRSTKSPSWSERLLGSSPQPIPPVAFGLDAERLSFARFERTGTRVAVTDFRWLPLPADSFHDGILGGTLKDPHRFAEILAQFVSELPSRVKTAALVLPDAWVRAAFAEGGDLPKPGPARDEALRFKLKRLVPFRVDELRVSGTELPSLSHGAPRLLLGFGLDSLLAQLEDAFAACGVSLGLITSASLAVVSAVGQDDAESLSAVALVGERAYTMVFARGSEPMLYRYKAAARDLSPAAQGGLVSRDLRLTRTFLDEQLAGARLDRVLLVAAPEEAARWKDWIENGLDIAAEPLHRSHLPLVEGPALELAQLAPLLGAATLEVV